MPLMAAAVCSTDRDEADRRISAWGMANSLPWVRASLVVAHPRGPLVFGDRIERNIATSLDVKLELEYRTPKIGVQAHSLGAELAEHNQASYAGQHANACSTACG